jgi:hypothetical protein
MRTNILITDNFYGDPDSIRKFALNQVFDVKGNYPGARTRSFLNAELKETVQTIVWNAGGEVNNWFEKDGYTGSFQLTTANDRSWIHTDHFNKWAGVLYLTPDAPVTSGTGLFMYKKNNATTAAEMGDEPYDAQDMTKWHKYDVIANRYNRLVLYRGDLFHSSLDYFGSTSEDGRLFQLFFFDTVY